MQFVSSSLSAERDRQFYCEYDLDTWRQHASYKTLLGHQKEAHDKLLAWYELRFASHHGGILVLPTGGGKTFTAEHFACRKPLSDNYKVLWLAHTHHLLEQAYVGLGDVVSRIAEPKKCLRVRVVSGTKGHFKVKHIQPDDDVLIASLQTVTNAIRNNHANFNGFLSAAGAKLFVVFDEAHHSPAPSYRRIIEHLLQSCPQLRLLGLTATPKYTNPRKQSWLLKLFPQGILHQVSPQELMLAGVLAKPILEETKTDIKPDFDDSKYHEWVKTHQDLPEDIIHSLAINKERNNFIVNAYVRNKTKYGKTIIFADRWHQCDYLREHLIEAGVKADVVYSHIDADPGSAEARNQGKADENAHVLQRFRNGELDVLINVRMLTEGTDFPKVETVFLTRQTTSEILLTQMIGRALRGPKVGGTEKANIVFFIDNWQQRINWAEYEQLEEVGTLPDISEPTNRRPLRLVSIELVRRLARQMDSSSNVNPGPYLTFLPVGWYWLTYADQVQGSDDTEPVDQLVMVFDGEEALFAQFIEAAKKEDLAPFQNPEVAFDDLRFQVEDWRRRFFGGTTHHIGSELEDDLQKIARHLAQNEGEAPRFIRFEERSNHDLDQIAQQFLQLNVMEAHKKLIAEYENPERYWKLLYPTYISFRSQYEGCTTRLLMGLTAPTKPPPSIRVAVPDDDEPPDHVKTAVKQRDGYQCLCCGEKDRGRLRIDHIRSRYRGGSHDPENLQTLCEACNTAKHILEARFGLTTTPLTAPPASFPNFATPAGERASSAIEWERFLRRSINLFYCCSAVTHIETKGKHWHVWLGKHVNEKWLQPYRAPIMERIQEAAEAIAIEPVLEELKLGF
jgi:ATP-dependent helicase IRC3